MCKYKERLDCLELRETDCCTMQRELKSALNIALLSNTAEGASANKVLHYVRNNVHAQILPRSKHSHADAPGLTRMHWLT